MGLIYKILSREEWQAALAARRFEGSAVDRQDGFIHFSTAEQAPETARRHFAGQPDLVVLAVEADDLSDALKWEPSRGGALFPHLYAHFDPFLVRAIAEAPLGPDGAPVLAL
ncbi:MAG: DUF952 domain-containing protein [Phenylobacterium sp.]